MYGIMCYRSAASVMGRGESRLKSNGVLVVFETEDEACAEANRLNKNTASPYVFYQALELAGA